MSTQYIVDEKGEKISVVLSMDEYRTLLDRAVAEDETAYLLQSPENARVLRERLADVRRGEAREHELLETPAPVVIPEPKARKNEHAK